MSATSKTIRRELADLIQQWIDDAPAGYNIPIDKSNIKRYATAPADQSDSPNWIILASLGTHSSPFVSGDSEEPYRFALVLMSRLGGDEKSREAAEDWIDDAEEYLLQKLTNSTHQYWHQITQLDEPRRDHDQRFWGIYRTSLTPIEVDKI